jgi:multidrug efflux pump subunit AcrA (membrane-fusion protein)|tara:strand:+ start:4746 stop:5984 length:1239 start_codon:yes stop_codon:yes gene_type:complete
MRSRSILKFVLPLLVIAVAFGSFWLLKGSKPDREKPEVKEKVWQVDVMLAVKQNISPELTLYGRVESPELLNAAAPGSGVISQVLVQDGTQVKQGDILVSMDQRDFTSVMVQARSDLTSIRNQIIELKIRHRSNRAALKTERELLNLANANVQRMLKLKQQNLGTDSAVNDARSALGRQQLSVISRELEVKSFNIKKSNLETERNRQVARLNDAQLMIDRSEVIAPFNAIISSTPVSIGDRVSTGQTLVSLYPINGLEIRAHVPARYVNSIQQAITAGEQHYALVSTASGILQLQLIRLAGEAEASGIDAFFRSGDSSHDFRPGSLLSLNFGLPEQSELVAIPYQAIYGDSRVYLLKQGRLVAVNVESVGQYLKPDGSAALLIRSNKISENDQIVVTHLPNAVDGLKVRLFK